MNNASNFTKPGTYLITDRATLTQLERWQLATLDWPRYSDSTSIRCGECSQTIYRIRDDKGNKYVISDADCLALFVAHLRQNHEEIGKEFAS